MAEKEHERLFGEFAPNTMQQWKEKVTADLKGADFNRKLVWKTGEGFDAQPMYRLENMKELAVCGTLPGEFPYVRGNKKDGNDWLIRQEIEVVDVREANRKALDILTKGVHSIGFVIDPGIHLDSGEINLLLAGIHPQAVELNFAVRQHEVAFLHHLMEAFGQKGTDPGAVSGGINIDPLCKLLLRGRFDSANPFETVREAVTSSNVFSNFKVIEVGGFIFNNSGSSLVQELAFSLAAGVEYLDRLTDMGLRVEEIAPRMRFHFAVGSKYFMEIAKFRAARYLWAHIVKGYLPSRDSVCKMHIHAETSQWNKTVYDPNVNMLRTQTEAMSAVLGGVDSFTVHPYDYVYACHPSELGERVARNQQLLLKEESHFGKVADAAGGSYYIEELTQSIADAAWKLFLEIEEKGGFLKAVETGSIASAVKATAQKRDQAIATRRENFLGTNQFPNFDEVMKEPLPLCVFEPEDATVAHATVETLKPYRGTQAFELLRMKTDMWAREHGHRPVVYMLPLGNPAMRKARSQFACNFFACAGFQVIDNNGFETVEEGVKASLDHKAAIVVICSSDDEYATIAPEIHHALKDKAIVVVAGNPECRAELEAQGMTNFISVKSNVLQELKEYQQKVGIN